MASKDRQLDPWADAEPGGRKAKRAAKKAAKAANKKTPWFKQIWQVYQMTRKAEPLIWLRMTVLAVGVIAIGAVIGLLWSGHLVYMLVISTPIGLVSSLFVLARRAEKAAYGQIEGKPGAAYAALGQIKRGWTIDQEPVAVDPKTQDMVFRAVGRPGVVLIGDGDPARLGRMLKKERQRLARSLSGVTVTELIVGNEAGQVPLMKLSRKLQRLKPTLSRAELAAVNSRVKSFGPLRPPMPKGIDPMRARPDRKALRGR